MYDAINRREALRRVGFLMGGALSASTVSAILGGCRGRAVNDAAHTFATLDAGQQALTGTLVDLILPETDTPGARAAGAHEFIDKMLSDWMRDEDRTRFLSGLAEVDARARREHGSAFLDLGGDRQVALLTALDREAYAAPAAAAEGTADEAASERAQSGTDAMQEEQEREVGQPEEAPGDSAAPVPTAPADPAFFRTLKELTLAGYYTSEIGATQELQWLATPGRYDADVPLAEVGRAWA